MLIHLLILALGLNIQFTDISPRGEAICGTDYYSQKTIVLSMQPFCNSNENLYHEVGHQLFLHDQEVKNIISHYQPPRFYYSTEYPTDEGKLNERVADYFAMYIKYPDFPEKFPELKELFDRKTRLILNK